MKNRLYAAWQRSSVRNGFSPPGFAARKADPCGVWSHSRTSVLRARGEFGGSKLFIAGPEARLPTGLGSSNSPMEDCYDGRVLR